MIMPLEVRGLELKLGVHEVSVLIDELSVWELRGV
jgi:hypothetical protein